MIRQQIAQTKVSATKLDSDNILGNLSNISFDDKGFYCFDQSLQSDNSNKFLQCIRDLVEELKTGILDGTDDPIIRGYIHYGDRNSSLYLPPPPLDISVRQVIHIGNSMTRYILKNPMLNQEEILVLRSGDYFLVGPATLGGSSVHVQKTPKLRSKLYRRYTIIIDYKPRENVVIDHRTYASQILSGKIEKDHIELFEKISKKV